MLNEVKSRLLPESKYILIGLAIIFIFSSCKEIDLKKPKVVKSDTTIVDKYAEFNAELVDDSSIQTSEDLIRHYYGDVEIENPANLTVNTQQVGKDINRITLIHDKLMDDSMQAIKIIMIAKKTNNDWQVLDIQKVWKCWDGRGHTEFSTELCN